MITSNAGLEAYNGPWTRKEANQLMRRVSFGADFRMIDVATDIGLNAVVDELLKDIDNPEPPLNYDFLGDPEVPVGTTWVDKGFNVSNFANNYRQRSIRAWCYGLYLSKTNSIRDKLTLFWHNHFVIANTVDARYLYRYYDTLQSMGQGSFKELVKAMTIDPAMLQYLNGNLNQKQSPNENYARELLELFTVGKGQLAGSGDYTTFTEQDVQAIAKVLTGWVDYGSQNVIINTIGSLYVDLRHDQSDKQLSHRFGNTVISNNKENEYSDLIDVIFEYGDVASFICRKLYRWFVHYEITDSIESQVIQPLAQVMRDNDYEIKPVLDTLLRSAHFYEEDRIGCMIKNPIDFTINVFNQLNIGQPTELNVQYNLWLQIYSFCTILQMDLFNPPNVAGWKAYYQGPSYYQLWINSVTIPLRRLLTDAVLFSGLDIMNVKINVLPLKIIESFDDPYDINAIIDNFNELLTPRPLTVVQKGVLKSIVLQGLPDFEWSVEYSNYLSNPDDEDLARSIDLKLRVMLITILRMPESYLS